MSTRKHSGKEKIALLWYALLCYNNDIGLKYVWNYKEKKQKQED